ncbi:hypothetical protein F511_27296 [Dorcoceras hygrometricum]|uniref:Uncharacterized protein n=1 Tax=Dorcoceras hygrometricum TaxID=472368 RepID=A0A2Z7D2A0_9LAMI|nr:hypothetical protein F511_27296 [Dorcoceras hygrometricum]
MEHTRVARMFHTLEETWLIWFLAASSTVYESAVVEFFATAKVIAGTIVSFMANRKLVLTKETFAEAFGLPTEGMKNFLDIPSQTVVDIRGRFSGSDVPFRAPIKKREMKMEFRLLHDIVAKALCAKAGSLDKVRVTRKHRTKRAKKVPPTVNDQAVSQPNPISDIPAGGDRASTVGGPEAYTETTPALETQAGDESIAGGPEGHVGTNPEQEDELMGLIPMVISNKSVWSVRPKRTKRIEEWVDNVARIEHEDSSNQIEKETATNERAIVMRSGPEQPAHDSQTYTGKNVYAPIEIREINCVTYFLPKIDPADKGKGVLPFLDRPIPIEEHYLLVNQDIRERAECQLQIYNQWHKFQTGYRLSKIQSMKLVEKYAKIENKLLPWAETDKLLLSTGMNFTRKPSANQDLMEIRLLEAEMAQTRKSINLFQARAEGVERDHAAPEKYKLGSKEGEQTMKQPDPEEGGQPQESSSYSSSCRFSVHNEDSVYSFGPYSSDDPSLSLTPSMNLGPNPVSDVNNTGHQGPSPSNLHFVYTVNREENTRITYEEDVDYSQACSQQVFVSSPLASLNANTKLEELEKVVVSLDYKVQSMESKVHSMDSKVISLDSKVEELLNIQTFMKHDFGVYKRAFYEKMDTMAANVASSQTSLETSLVRKLTEHQLKLASDLDFVKLQLAEVVNHLRGTSDAKKGERGQSSGFGGPRGPSSGPRGGPSSGPSNKKGDGTSSYKK